MAKTIAWSISAVLAIGLTAMAAPPPTTRIPPAAATPSTRAALARHKAFIARCVHLLDSKNPLAREDAENSLYLLPTEAFPLVESAAGDTRLSAAAAAKLHQIIEHERPWIEARKRKAAKLRTTWQWNRRTMLDAYEQAGKKSPKWDKAAREGMELYLNGDPNAAKPLQQALDAGCDDPLIICLAARLKEKRGESHDKATLRLYGQAAYRMDDANYPPRLKMAVYMHAFKYAVWLRNHSPRSNPELTEDYLHSLHNAAMRLWPAMLKEPGLPQADAADMADRLVDISIWPDLHKKAFDWVDRALRKAYPDSAMALVFEGKFYVHYAWDARGDGWGNMVTPQAMQLMQQRLLIAQERLEKAWKMDPADSAAPTAMITVEMGQGLGRDRMEKWFRRAMDADPDNLAACRAKLLYLQPRWYGSTEDVLAFARDCVRGKNWRGGIPFILSDALDSLLYYPGKESMAFTPAFWRDLQSIYVPYLRVEPDDLAVRSRWAYWASYCEHWNVALQQFNLLGDRAVVHPFGTQHLMDYYWDQAIVKATPTSQPAAP